jgi:hypothetical protein
MPWGWGLQNRGPREGLGGEKLHPWQWVVCFFGAVVNSTTAANGHAIIVENTEHIIYLFLKDLTHIIFYEHVWAHILSRENNRGYFSLQEKDIVRRFFYVHRGWRSYFELRLSVLKPTYVTYIRRVVRVADKYKVSQPPPRRPFRLMFVGWSARRI